MKLLIAALSLSILAPTAFGQETSEVASGTSTQNRNEFQSEAEGFADHKHFIGSGLRTGVATGPTFTYARPASNRWLIGATLGAGRKDENKEGGDLLNSQYYKDEDDIRLTTLDLNAAFYFRDNGLKRWGPFVRAGLGHAWARTSSKWGRYDKDPGLFQFGDGKRLRESATASDKWEASYAKLGAYYQFAWGMRPESRAGHILELGIAGMQFDKEKSLTSRKPNGNSHTYTTKDSQPALEVNYSVAF